MPFSYSNTSVVVDGVYPQIVGGLEVKIDDFPFFVALSVLTSNGLVSRCGASLVAGRYLLTAAHCLQDAVSVTALFDSNRYSDFFSLSAFLVKASNFIVHEGYNEQTFENDLALVVLDTPVLRPRVELFVPSLYLPELIGVGKTVVAIGEGLTSYGGGASDSLQSVWLSVYPEFYKEGIYKGFGKNTMLAGGINKGTCQGDSGGPLLLPYGNSWLQVGVSSYSYLCGLEHAPAAFASVPLLWDFVNKNVEREKSKPAIVNFRNGKTVSVNFGLFR